MPTDFRHVNCVQAAVSAAKNLTDQDAVDLIKDIATYIEGKQKSGEVPDIKKMLKELKDMVVGEVEMHTVEKRNALLAAQTRAKIDKYLGGFSDPGEGLAAYMGGSVKAHKGALNSIDARGKSIVSEHLGKMISDLEKENLLEIFNRDLLEPQIAKELWEIRPGGNPGVSGSPEAKKIADILYKYQKNIMELQNSYGAWVKDLPGYVTRQSHDASKLRKAGFESWRDFIIDMLDQERTFASMGDEQTVDNFLRGAYDGLVSGLHKRVQGEGEFEFVGKAIGFHGPSALAKKVSQHRVLHFKDADSWLKYNEVFGTHNLRETVIGSLEHGGRSVALMEGFGPNPLMAFDNIVRKLKLANQNNLDNLKSLSSQHLQNLFKELDGTTHIPGDVTGAKISAGIRSIQNMAKLGGAVISSISDIPFQAAELRYQGHNIFSAYGEAFTNLFRGRGNSEQKDIARMIGVGLEGIMGDILSRFTVQDSIPGMAAKLQQRFFKLNGMSWWNDAHKTGIGLVMANHLAENAHLEYGALDKDITKVFRMYDINDREWNVFRNSGHMNAGDNRYLTPDAIGNMNNDTFKQLYGGIDKYTDKQVDKLKHELETTWRTYFIDRADFAVPHPGAVERSYMTMGTQPGTVLGEAIRFIMQFKSFPLAALRKGVGRELFGDGAETIGQALLKGKGDMLGLTHLVAASTVFGYLAMASKDLLKGREPRSLDDPKTWMAACAQGGGFGIYGDFLFGEMSRYGRTFLSSMAGPTFGQIDDIAEIYTRVREGNDPSAQAVRLAINNTPFINLFYTRGALDYLILYQLQEMVNPGYLHRMEARIERENDQHFYLPPSSVISYGGQGGLFESIR